jgi:hypothetical protein
MNEQLSNFLDRAIAEGWKVESLLRRVNNEIGDDGEPVSVGEATNALRERGFRVIENGIRKIGEWAFSEDTREKLLQLADNGAHMDELFDAPGADVDDPTDFVEANGYAFDDDDCCIAVGAVGVPRPAATPKATVVGEAKTPTPEARAKKKTKLSDEGLPKKITLKLARVDLRHVPGYPNVYVSRDQFAFVREHSDDYGDHFRMLPRKRNPRTGTDYWILGLGEREKKAYLKVATVMYNTGFWCPVARDKRKKRTARGV